MSDSDENIPNNNEQIDPWHSKLLDVRRWSDHPQRHKLTRILSLSSIGPDYLVFMRTGGLTVLVSNCRMIYTKGYYSPSYTNPI